MARLEVARRQMELCLDRHLPVVAAAIAALPEGRTDFRPTPESMSASELALHVHQVVAVVTSAAVSGRFDRTILERYGIDDTQPQPPAVLLEFASRATADAREALAGLHEGALARSIGDGPGELTGANAIELVCEEVLHHRGQLQLYLRLMGIEPPKTFPWTD